MKRIPGSFRAATLIAALVSTTLAGSAALIAVSYQNSNAITEERLRTHLEFIASDDLEGRNTPSKGLDVACNYVATQLKLWGVKPGGEKGTYFQTLDLSTASVKADGTTLTLGGKTHSYGDGFYAATRAGSASGSLVFVGHGWKIPKMQVDPYAGLDVKGKILLVLSGQPPNFGFRERRGPNAEGAKSAEQMAAELGAAGVIYVPRSATLVGWDRSVETSKSAGRTGMPSFSAPAPTVPAITLNDKALETILQGESVTVADLMEEKVTSAFALKAEKTVSFQVEVSKAEQTTRNVIGIIPGNDPKLAAEYVAVGAHIDHLGTGTRGDGIYNGADDDGSGTVAILEMAHAFATGKKPRRSIIFVWHTGEEKGLWGSRYFCENPTVPLDKIVAQLNIDMIGRSKAPGDTDPRNADLTGPDAVQVIGLKRMSTDLAKWAHAANGKLHGIEYREDYDIPNDPQSLFTRSDHYRYALKGIPVLFWFSGLHADYHQPDDEIDRIDFRKLCRVAQTVYTTAFEVANQPARPKVDLPLDISGLGSAGDDHDHDHDHDDHDHEPL